MTRLTIDFRGFEEFAQLAENLGPVLIARVFRRIRTPVTRIYRLELRRQIKLATERRTGRLARGTIRPRPFGRGARSGLRLFPDFPATAYVTPGSRGRRAASKKGQYGFVVNNAMRPNARPRHFIQKAFNNASARREAQRAIATAARAELRKLLGGLPA